MRKKLGSANYGPFGFDFFSGFSARFAMDRFALPITIPPIAQIVEVYVELGRRVSPA